MIKKIQSYLNVVLVLFVIVGIIYFLIALVVDAFEKGDVINKENVDLYTLDENLVTSYSIFNTLEKCTSSFFEAILDENYSDIYKIIGKNTKKNYSKDEIMQELKEYSQNSNSLDAFGVVLNRVYNSDNGYILDITYNTNYSLYIIVNLDLYEMSYTIDLVM